MQIKATVRHHRSPGHVLAHDMGGGFPGENPRRCTLKDVCAPLSIVTLIKMSSKKERDLRNRPTNGNV